MPCVTNTKNVSHSIYVTYHPTGFVRGGRYQPLEQLTCVTRYQQTQWFVLHITLLTLEPTHVYRVLLSASKVRVCRSLLTEALTHMYDPLLTGVMVRTYRSLLSLNTTHVCGALPSVTTVRTYRSLLTEVSTHIRSTILTNTVVRTIHVLLLLILRLTSVARH